MAKLTLSDITNLLGNPTSAQNTINSNSDILEAAFDNTLSRNGASPNQMNSDIDMNNHDLINVNTLDVQNLSYQGLSLPVLVEEAQDAAESSQLSASLSQTASVTSGISAAASQNYSNNSYKWSSEAEDVIVNDGLRTGYSAYHWSKKAQSAAGGGVTSWVGLNGVVTKAQAQSAIDLGNYVLTATYTSGLAGKANTSLDNVSQADVRTKAGTGTNAYRALTVSTSDPSGGVDGDVWYKV